MVRGRRWQSVTLKTELKGEAATYIRQNLAELDQAREGAFSVGGSRSNGEPAVVIIVDDTSIFDGFESGFYGCAIQAAVNDPLMDDWLKFVVFTVDGENGRYIPALAETDEGDMKFAEGRVYVSKGSIDWMPKSILTGCVAINEEKEEGKGGRFISVVCFPHMLIAGGSNEKT